MYANQGKVIAMKIGVIGTGAIGGYFGSKLLKAGFDVTFIDVDKTLKAIKQRKGLLRETLYSYKV